MGDLIHLEPRPSFHVDRERGVVTWEANGLRLVHADQFRALSEIFAENNWKRHYTALHEAELAVSEVVVRDMLTASVADVASRFDFARAVSDAEAEPTNPAA